MIIDSAKEGKSALRSMVAVLSCDSLAINEKTCGDYGGLKINV